MQCYFIFEMWCLPWQRCFSFSVKVLLNFFNNCSRTNSCVQRQRSLSKTNSCDYGSYKNLEFNWVAGGVMVLFSTKFTNWQNAKVHEIMIRDIYTKTLRDGHVHPNHVVAHSTWPKLPSSLDQKCTKIKFFADKLSLVKNIRIFFIFLGKDLEAEEKITRECIKSRQANLTIFLYKSYKNNIFNLLHLNFPLFFDKNLTLFAKLWQVLFSLSHH